MVGGTAAGAAPEAAGGGGGPGFNKMFVMIPVMLAARKLDAEDPETVHWLRVAYGTMQTICVVVVLYTYLKASSSSSSSSVVYVPAAATPFADPNAKKKYTQMDYHAHIVSTARSLVGSTLFGVLMTVGLHVYKGMAMGLAIQTIMGPLNLFENPLVKALFLGNGFRREDKIFDEKSANELVLDEIDEVLDANGNAIPNQTLTHLGARETASSAARAIEPTAGATTTTTAKESAFDKLLLDTWDLGNKTDIPKFMKGINKQNCNDCTTENRWTPLMILSGLDADGTVEAIKTVIEDMGGNPAITDNEGWNALHWSAFHGSLKAAKELMDLDPSLLDVKDNDGKLPLDMAVQEDNKDIAVFLGQCSSDTDDVVGSNNDDEGLRKRK